MPKETILIVDDNREIVAALSDVLKSKGYVALTAYDGAKGLELAMAQSPDLILLDWNLPELSGMQVLQALRDQGYQAPVILMTVYGSEIIAVQAFKLGIRDYIRKPVRMPETLEAVEKALAEDRLRREKERISKELADTNRRLEQQLLEITTLHAIARSITAVLDLEQVLARVVGAACYFATAQEGVLFLLDQENDTLSLRAYHGQDRSRTTDFRLRYSTSPLRQAVETGAPLLLNSNTPGYSIKLKTDYLVRSLLFVPLKIKDRPIGVLGVTDKLGGQLFGPDEVRLLTALADYAAIAIENARLNESEKELARTETVKRMIVTLSHYIMNPLTAISLSTYELLAKHDQGIMTSNSPGVRRCLQLIEMNVKEIVAVMGILQKLVSPKSVVYVGDIEMIDIEDEVKRRVAKIQADYGFPHAGEEEDLGDIQADGDVPSTVPDNQ
ncbi:MAG: response regulator [Anaerolineae bacterium]|nr:response regulator [Anaerolineae bacterium]